LSKPCSLRLGDYFILSSQDKIHNNLGEAVDDVLKKVRGIPPAHYGDVWFILAICASGSSVQAFLVQLIDGQTVSSDMSRYLAFVTLVLSIYACQVEMHQLHPVLNLDDVASKLQWLCILSKVKALSIANCSIQL
jgi:hypothetical protein